MKNFIIFLFAISCYQYSGAQDSSKTNKINFTHTDFPWFIDINVSSGIISNSLTTMDLRKGYLDPVLANFGSITANKGSSYGANGQFGYFFGEKKHFGVGLGIVYSFQSNEIIINNFHIEYKSLDNNKDTFRQILSSVKYIKESITTTNINVPLVLKYKTQLNKRFGFGADLGILYNFVMQNNYSSDALLNYEAAYKYNPETGKTIYDNSPIYGKDDILYTIANTKGNVAVRFDSLRNQQGYNVGLNIKPNQPNGTVNYKAGSLGFIFQPSVYYDISDKCSLNFGLYFNYQSIVNTPDNNYKISDKVGQYNSILNAITNSSNISYGVNIGLRYYIGKLKDKDHDGIPDKKDRCPNDSGLLKFKGCPDSDHDGIPDVDDSCPHQFGVLKFHGCPDTDGDGIPDKLDACPYLKGPAKFNGCPDSDGDGIPDKNDSCPRQAGLIQFNGCPDSDGDGIPDNIDACPFEAGTIENKGCPDKIVVNEKPTNQPIKNKKIKEITRKQIHFDFNKISITKNSIPYVDNIIKAMKENPETILSIDGFSDNVGPSSANIRVSKNRALAVKQYMIKKGIDPNRIRARGYGYRKPIASNQTATGRAQNRRATLVVKSNTVYDNEHIIRNSSAISVYPNEDKGSFTILLKTNFEENALVTITNASGKKVKEFNIIGNKPTEFTLDEPAGLYSFTAATSTMKYEARIIIAQ